MDMKREKRKTEDINKKDRTKKTNKNKQSMK